MSDEKKQELSLVEVTSAISKLASANLNNPPYPLTKEEWLHLRLVPREIEELRQYKWMYEDLCK